MNRPTILVIYDEAQTRKILEIALQSNDYGIIQASTAEEGLALVTSHAPDQVLLQLDLPEINDHTALQQLRERYTKPVIVLSVQGNEENIVKALHNGANDYLVKPFLSGELLARVSAALRVDMPNAEQVMSYKDLDINLSKTTVRKGKEVVDLTATEYSLLRLFVRHEGNVMTHQYLLREIWGPGYINQSQYLRFNIAELRKKIENDPNRPTYIVTESGIGYRFIGK